MRFHLCNGSPLRFVSIVSESATSPGAYYIHHVFQHQPLNWETLTKASTHTHLCLSGGQPYWSPTFIRKRQQPYLHADRGTAKASGAPLFLQQIFPAENCGIHARRVRPLLLGRLQCSRALSMITCTAQLSYTSAGNAELMCHTRYHGTVSTPCH